MAGDSRLQIWKSPRFWLIVVVIFAIPLLADFNARLAYIRQMGTEAAELSKQIAIEEARRDALLALQDYVRSDEYVEHWARLARMARPGETAVVPSVSGNASSPANATPLPTPVPNDPRNEWTALFLGSH
jgi:hypothetical protein